MKLGLAFSGGKDSLACLLLHKHKLDEITVFWVNAGKNYPETLELVSYAKSISPNFVEIKSNQEAQQAINGLPSDVVPINWTVLGQSVTGAKPYSVQSYLQCCFENISIPMHNTIKEHGITHLIRGQRKDEGHKSTATNGHEYDGVVYLHPIEDWSAQEVIEFIAKHIKLPKHYYLNHTSLDCYDCTAYRKETKDIKIYRQTHHPELHAQYLEKEEKLNQALKEAMEI